MNEILITAQPWFVRYPLTMWKYLVGVVLCQSMLGAVIVVGWTTRLMQRQIYLAWWKKSPLREQGSSFQDFIVSLSNPCATRTLPNWCLVEPRRGVKPQAASGSRLTKLVHSCFGSLYLNFRQGVVAALGILIFTLPATSLWLYSWVLGWNISFFKLYEQSGLGLSLGLLGILLFLLAMLNVPLAHARQAVTGQWQRFFDLRANFRLARRHPGLMLPAAILFVVASGMVMLLRIAPYYIGSEPEFATMSIEQLRQWLENYYLATGMLLLPAYMLVWLSVAKAYARAAVREYVADPAGCPLGELERQALANLQYSAPAELSLAHPLVRGASWTFGRVTTTAAFGLICLAWFGVAAQVFVAQFFNYLPGASWLNHPLVLLPWIKTIPAGLIP